MANSKAVTKKHCVHQWRVQGFKRSLEGSFYYFFIQVNFSAYASSCTVSIKMCSDRLSWLGVHAFWHNCYPLHCLLPVTGCMWRLCTMWRRWANGMFQSSPGSELGEVVGFKPCVCRVEIWGQISASMFGSISSKESASRNSHVGWVRKRPTEPRGVWEKDSWYHTSTA